MNKFIVALALLVFLSPSILIASEPLKDPFYTMGHELAGNRTFDQMYESVDPFSGFLTLSNTDLVLPGNGGLDVKIIRNYNSGIWSRRDISNPGLVAWNDWSPLGIGWSMHMGIVRNPYGQGSQSYVSPNNPIVEMADGSQHTLYIQKNASPNMITKDYWIYKSLGAGVWTLTLSDGTVYTFEYNSNTGNNAGYVDRAGVPVAQVTSIKNAAGTAAITIHYDKSHGDGYAYLSYVTDSVGRTIQFNYNYTTHILISITVDNRTFAYSYQTINTGGIFGNQNFLIKVTPPTGGGSPWKYTYNSTPSTFDLQMVTFPAGGTIAYSYSNKPFDTGISDVYFRVVTQRTTSGGNSNGTIPSGTWTYSYTTGGTTGNITNVTGPGGISEVHTFNAWGNNCPSAGPCSNIWKIGLPMSKEVKMNGSQILYESYAWSKGTQISNDYVENGDWNSASIFIYDSAYMPFLSAKSTKRDGQLYTTTYSSYDAYGNPLFISESGDKTRSTTLTYWTNVSKNMVKGRVASEAVSGGFPGSFISTYAYDVNSGNRIQTNRYGVVTNYGYFSNGNLRFVTDANGKTTYYQWSNGRISQIQPPELGTTVNRVINTNGTTASETNGRGYTTYYAYDGNLRLTAVTPAVGNPTTYWYASDNSYKRETRGSFYTNYYYDGFGRPAGTSDSKGITTDIKYKSYEVKDYSTSNIGDRVNYDYFGRPMTVIHQDNSSILYSYAGSNVTVTDESANTTRLYYNAFGNPEEKLLVKVNDATGVDTTYTYNLLGSITGVNLGSVPRTFTYDGKNFLTSEASPERGNITYRRDYVGNMISKTDGLGAVTYSYDNIYRLKTVNYGSGTVTFGYDGANNRTSMINPAASIYYTYDEANRLTAKGEVVGGRSYSMGYSYDGNDNMTNIYYPSGTQITYQYNANNQIISATSLGQGVTSVNYCTTAPCIGLPSSFTISPGLGGLTTQMQYTPRNLTSRITVGASVLNLAYVYDTRRNLSQLIDYVTPASSQSMSYDGLNRLAVFNGAWGSGSFSYYANGDRYLKTVAGISTNYYYSNNKVTTAVGGEPFSFLYNGAGDAVTINGISLSYDRLHNLTSYNSSLPASFGYDGDGMRVTKTYNRKTTVYHYDKEGKIIAESDGATGAQIADYAYLNGKLLAKILPGPAGYIYHTDPAGTPVAITNPAGTVVWRADYKPFGQEQSIIGTIENNDRFVGKEKDKETGLQYFGARYMKNEIGRFISPDPVGPVDPKTSKTNYGMLTSPQKLNVYAYALNNPFKYFDANGKWAEDVHSGIGKSTYGTYTWARQAGFSPKEARIIANGNNRTDGGPWTSFLPVTGDQSRHFNQPYLFDKNVGDTRDYWARVEFQGAVQYMKEGNADAALGHLGKGLHSLQDKFAHRDWDTGVVGWNEHPPWYDKWDNGKNSVAAEKTGTESLNYLKSFKEIFQ